MNNIKFFIENNTIDDIFKISVKKFKKEIFLSHPKIRSNKTKNEYTYEEVFNYTQTFKKYFDKLQIKQGDRVAVIVGNIPEFFIIKLSLNCIGVSCVPINYELTLNEINYIIKHSNSRYIITSIDFLENIKKIVSKKISALGILLFKDNNLIEIKKNKVKKRKTYKKILPSSEASLLYTSGTTGKPKACILSHFYEINAGFSYLLKKELVSIRIKNERLYNCLPVHHVNSGIFSFYAILISGNCQIQAKRFSTANFWKEIKYSNATIFHYLGIMAPVLLKKKKSKLEINNKLRLGVGAGIEPALHKKFEKRFKIPMVELWGMTEMVRCIFDNKKNRIIGKRCFGKPDKSLEIKLYNAKSVNFLFKQGELLIRHNSKNPKKGFFTGYYKNIYETKKIWKNNWFHTGDIVKIDKFNNLYFVDRKKNIIRRSGENISSAEIEATLLGLSEIKNTAVCAYPHEIYDEEVLAFIILKNKKNETEKYAKKIIYKLSKNLTYFKLPAYIQFTDKLPVTSSQKIKKNNLIKKFKEENKLKIYDLCEYKKLFKIK